METVLDHLRDANKIAISHKDFEMSKYLVKLIQWSVGRIESPSTKGESNVR
jgi:hypothetical protein